MSRLWQPKPPYRFKRQVNDASEITLKMLEELLFFAIRLVDRYGPVAQPMLSRFEQEYFKAIQMKATVQEIRETLADLATIIETAPEGDKYWPLFDRMERELAMRLDRDARLKAALAYDAADGKKGKATDSVE